MRKVLEWTHRIVGFTILESLISVIGFIGLYQSIMLLEELNKMTLGVRIGLVQASIGIAFLSVANIFYWFLDINLFDFKLWREKCNSVAGDAPSTSDKIKQELNKDYALSKEGEGK